MTHKRGSNWTTIGDMTILKFDRCIWKNKQQGRATQPFLKMDRGHGDPPIQSPNWEGPLLLLYDECSGNCAHKKCHSHSLSLAHFWPVVPQGLGWDGCWDGPLKSTWWHIHWGLGDTKRETNVKMPYAIDTFKHHQQGTGTLLVPKTRD